MVQNNLNRPVVSLNKPEYQNFSINYVSSIAFIKEKIRENRYKKNDQKYVAYPPSNSLLLNRISKRVEHASNGTKPKSRISLKNDLDGLYDFLSQQKKNIK